MRRVVVAACVLIVLVEVLGPAKAASHPATRPSVMIRADAVETDFPKPLSPRPIRPHKMVSEPVKFIPAGPYHSWPKPPACCGPSAAAVEAMISATFGAYASAALAVANCESHFDWQAQNSSSGASGIYQFTPGWWWDGNRYLFDVWDAQANINMAFSASKGGTSWSAWSCKP